MQQLYGEVCEEMFGKCCNGARTGAFMNLVTMFALEEVEGCYAGGELPTDRLLVDVCL